MPQSHCTCGSFPSLNNMFPHLFDCFINPFATLLLPMKTQKHLTLRCCSLGGAPVWMHSLCSPPSDSHPRLASRATDNCFCCGVSICCCCSPTGDRGATGG